MRASTGSIGFKPTLYQSLLRSYASPFIPQSIYIFDVHNVTTKTTELIYTFLSYKYCWKIMTLCRQKELF